VDTGPLRDLGIPTMANVVQDTPDHRYYFTYHHTAGDSITMMNATEMDSNVAGFASLFFILADYEYTSLRDPVPLRGHLRQP
jgi:carboxypeptidase Q